MMNVGLPSANITGCESCYRPFILFSKRDPPEEEKTLRIRKFPRVNHGEECLAPSYTRRSTPYERPFDKIDLNKPIRVVKTRTTTVEIDKPVAFLEDKMIEQLLAMVNGEGVRSLNDETETPKSEDVPLEAKFDVVIKDEKTDNN